MTDGDCLSLYTCKHRIVFKQFDSLNFDSLAGKHQKHQNFALSQFCATQYSFEAIRISLKPYRKPTSSICFGKEAAFCE